MNLRVLFSSSSVVDFGLSFAFCFGLPFTPDCGFWEVFSARGFPLPLGCGFDCNKSVLNWASSAHLMTQLAIFGAWEPNPWNRQIGTIYFFTNKTKLTVLYIKGFRKNSSSKKIPSVGLHPVGTWENYGIWEDINSFWLKFYNKHLWDIFNIS